MIALILAMVWNRRGQAATLALLSLFAVAAAVAAPAYLRAADRAVAAGEVAVATPADRILEVVNRLPDRRDDPSGIATDLSAPGADNDLTGLPGFDYVYATEFPTVGLDPDVRTATRLVYRQKVCAHLTMTAGRCLIGESDLILDERTAGRLRVTPGDRVTLSYAVFQSDRDSQLFRPRGEPKAFLVAGLYRVSDPGDVYWGTHDYFAADTVFVNAASVTAMDHGATQQSLDGYGGPGALDVDRLPALRTGLATLTAATADLGGEVGLRTGIPAVLDRIDAGRAAAHRIVPVLAVSLVLLACLTIFLAVGYGTEGRRPELAVVALRGARWGQRWWLASGENLVAIVAGAVAGCLVGQLLVNLVAAWWFAGVGADPGLSSLRWAPAAAGAAVLTAVLAERRQLVMPVAELLRRAPAVRGSARAIAAEIVVVLLAAVAVAQLSTSGGALSGVGLFAAALVLLAAALPVARALAWWATGYSRRALRRGRLGPALAGFQLSRRPGAARLLALLVATVAVAGYATSAVDVAARQRGVQAGLAVGAPRVVSVGPIGRRALLAAVRRVDPDGRYAMAAVRLPKGTDAPPVLAVDTTRLAAVADWSDSGPGRAEAAGRLRPAEPTSPVLTGTTVRFDVSSAGFLPGKAVTLTAVLSPVTGLASPDGPETGAGPGDVVLPLGVLQPGRHTYDREAPACREGCLLNSLQIKGGEGSIDVAGRVGVHAVGAVRLTDPAGWRATEGGRVDAGADGLRVEVASLNGLSDGMFVQPTATPYPLPVAFAGTLDDPTVVGFDGRAVPVSAVSRIPVVPGVGAPAVLTDLDYADLLATGGTVTTYAQVWLGDRAPADVVQLLRDNGLTVLSDTRATQVRSRLDAQGPALAVLFYLLVAALAVILAAGALILAATVDRPRRVEDLSALRGQGLDRSALRQATLWTYPVSVAAAVVTGTGVALLAWRLTGWALPLAEPTSFPLPVWPRPLTMIIAALVVFALLAGVAVLAARRTLREIR
ncbi:ABC transporter permease [Micromonosporaceae bacterium Da 78-11]